MYVQCTRFRFIRHKVLSMLKNRTDTTGLSVISNFALNSLAKVPGEERPILNFKIKPKI